MGSALSHPPADISGSRFGWTAGISEASLAVFKPNFGCLKCCTCLFWGSEAVLQSSNPRPPCPNLAPTPASCTESSGTKCHSGVALHLHSPSQGNSVANGSSIAPTVCFPRFVRESSMRISFIDPAPQPKYCRQRSETRRWVDSARKTSDFEGAGKTSCMTASAFGLPNSSRWVFFAKPHLAQISAYCQAHK